ncbi:hypothetical protein GCM10010172_76190 [Paractinoplanes ferrugineus]|uniref:Uncharacterized protein n=1 Tax=Paractinoplanes ferrugineus TaxID=113564 RepID=A0A919J0P0_9ACTN|nr:hypothetical protein [Actinoplanes ferrugineus]GIE11227.1 hypothetical protein Afe05nite_30670 [Actinoplanes ferrugineus]
MLGVPRAGVRDIFVGRGGTNPAARPPVLGRLAARRGLPLLTGVFVGPSLPGAIALGALRFVLPADAAQPH